MNNRPFPQPSPYDSSKRWTSRPLQLKMQSVGALRDGGSGAAEDEVCAAGGDRIAYQVLGQGPPDLVMTTGGFSQIDIVWEDSGIALFSVHWPRSPD